MNGSNGQGSKVLEDLNELHRLASALLDDGARSIAPKAFDLAALIERRMDRILDMMQDIRHVLFKFNQFRPHALSDSAARAQIQ